jgi:hypothetical protein
VVSARVPLAQPVPVQHRNLMNVDAEDSDRHCNLESTYNLRAQRTTQRPQGEGFVGHTQAWALVACV